MTSSTTATSTPTSTTAIDWIRVARLALMSRALDAIEEERLVPEKKVLYQFSARGHEVAQIILGTQLTHPKDGVSAYYRSRGLLLALGFSIEDAFAAPMAKSGAYSDGRDIGVVCNMPNPGHPTVLPMAGDVGSQFTPAAGWAQAIRYRRTELDDESYDGAISVVLGGDAAVATNGFWSSLTIATTLKLPMLFFIEDNGYGISVPSDLQTPGGNIATNLTSFSNLRTFDGDGTNPLETLTLVGEAVTHVRSGDGPALLRVTVPRLCGHSGQDNQAYKPKGTVEEELAKDPLPKLRDLLLSTQLTEEAWQALDVETNRYVEEVLNRVLSRPEPDPQTVTRHVFCERRSDGSYEPSLAGGLLAEGVTLPEGTNQPEPGTARINMVAAIRQTLERELDVNPRMVVFGEDVGPKGGVHSATLGLQEKFGAERVFDTSLSEEGIIGRAVGMALAGLLPVPEIQFRKYADPATEQLNNCGTIRWRTNNRFAAPIVVRIPGGFAKVGDPWHSVSDEVSFAHRVGWRVAMPSNAQDAVGLLRTALRGHDPTIFFEHRALIDAPSARGTYPGDDYILPFGVARTIREGQDLTLVTWGAMVDRCEKSIDRSGASVSLIDLRTIAPWDRAAVIDSVRQTSRCLIVHEDTLTAGFGAEIAAVLVSECFFELDAPIERLAVPDVPIPHSLALMDAVLPSVESIAAKINQLIAL